MSRTVRKRAAPNMRLSGAPRAAAAPARAGHARPRSRRFGGSRYGSGVAGRKRVTIKDVAAATGLSPAAVSYAMRGLQTSPETQERVRRAAEELGYTGNAVARALARGSTGLVGVLSGSLEDLSEQRFVESLGRQLGRHDLHMLVVDARGEPERERMLARQLADQMVDGLIISPLDPSNRAWQDISEALPV